MRLFKLIAISLTSVVSVVTATYYQGGQVAQVVPVAPGYPMTGGGGFGYGGFMPMAGGGSGFGGIFSLFISRKMCFFLMFLMSLLFGINRGDGFGGNGGYKKHADYGSDPWVVDPWLGDGPGGAY